MDKRKKFNKILLSVFLLLIVAFVVVYATTFQKSNHIRVQQQVIDDLYTLKGSKHENIIVTLKPLKEFYLFDEEVWCSLVINNQSDEPYSLTTPIHSNILDITLISPKGERVSAIGLAEYIYKDFEIIPPHSKSNEYIFSLFMYMINADINIDNGIGNYMMFVNYQGINSNISQFNVRYPTNESDVYLYTNYSVNKIIRYSNINNPSFLLEDILIHKESAYAPKFYSTTLQMFYKLPEKDTQVINQYETYFDDYLNHFSDSPDMYNFIAAYETFITLKKGEHRETMVDVLDSLRQRSSSESVHSIIDMYLRSILNFDG